MGVKVTETRKDAYLVASGARVCLCFGNLRAKVSSVWWWHEASVALRRRRHDEPVLGEGDRLSKK